MTPSDRSVSVCPERPPPETRPGNLFFPVLLSLLPLLLLLWDPLGEGTRISEDTRRDWLERSDSWIHQIRQQSRLSYWPEEIARRLRRSLARVSPTPSEPATLAEAMNRARRTLSLKGLPEWRLWAMAFPGGNLTANGQLCSGAGLESGMRVFFTRFFSEMARNQWLRRDQAFDPVWMQRAIGLFGEPLFPDFFQARFRGRAFYVLFQGRFHLAVWDFLLSGRRPYGMFFLLFPIGEGPRQALRLCLRNSPPRADPPTRPFSS